uniref:Putative secreted protein n=1 Tax=Anopheles marajoara TaxID=58244 RepID=A0A2M4CDZ4_9DIPT
MRFIITSSRVGRPRADPPYILVHLLLALARSMRLSPCSLLTLVGEGVSSLVARMFFLSYLVYQRLRGRSAV